MIQLLNGFNYFSVKKPLKTVVPQNKLSLKKDTVSFKSLYDIQNSDQVGLSSSDILKVKELFANVSYGVDLEAILRDDNFRIAVNKDNLLLYNFVTPENSTSKLIGRCDELTYKFGKQLECLFQDKYKFYAVYKYNHYFLAASPEEQLLKDNLLTSVCKAKYTHFNLRKLPSNILFIDPSLKTYGTNRDEGFDSFTSWKLIPLESMNPYKKVHSIKIKYFPFSSNLVVGSVQRLFDKEFSSQFLKKFPVTLEFYKYQIEKDSFKVDVKVKIHGDYGISNYCSDEDLIKHSPILFRTVEKIRSKLNDSNA